MDTKELMESAESLIQSMALRDGPRDATDQIGMAQVLAMLAVANELKRLNDTAEAEYERSELTESVRIYGTGE